jgi:endonuclease III
MSNTNRAAILGRVHKVLKKHYKPVEAPSDRKVLEQLLFAGLLENSDFETAQECFAKLQESYFDWNEVRVTTIAELSEILASLPDPAEAAQRTKKCLQAVFETHYQFDLEALKKQNLGKSIADLEKLPGMSPFMVAYLTQTALAGHAIPLGRGAWDVLIAVGAATDQDWSKQHVAGMERAIQKNKGAEFFSLLHQCGVDLAASPQSTRVKAILVEIDTGAKERLVQWHQRKQAEEKRVAEQHAEEKRAARAEAAAAAAPKKPGKGTPEAESNKKGKGKEKEAEAEKKTAKTPPPAESKTPAKAADSKAAKPSKEKEAKDTKDKAAAKPKLTSKRLTKKKPK